MAYSSAVYLLLFLSGAVLGYYLTPLRYRWLSLLFFSILFYWINSGYLFFWLLGATLLACGAGLVLDWENQKWEDRKKGLDKGGRQREKRKVEKRKRILESLFLLLLFGCLFYCKYFNFFGRCINSLLQMAGTGARIPTLSILMPLGISFYTLAAAGYVIDVKRGKYRAEKNPCRLLLFLCFFPCIIEGPIPRYEKTGPELFRGHRFSYENFTAGLKLLMWGLFKKYVIADRANMFVGSVFEQYPQVPGCYIFLGMLCYTLQLYAEFSGCMDLAAGSASLLGIRLEKNFSRPFAARTVNEFWQRWHISLGTWLRDYVFYGLFLSRPIKKLTKLAGGHFADHLAKWIPMTVALFFVWLGNGLWHGASFQYIGYGMYYFVLISLGSLAEPAVERLCRRIGADRQSRGLRLLAKLRTFLLVNVGMLLFRANGFLAGWSMAAALGKSIISGAFFETASLSGILSMGCDMWDFGLLAGGALVLMVVGKMQERGVSVCQKIGSLPVVLRFALYYALIFAVLIFGAYGDGYETVDFIYAGF